jgi:hypothetical protein
MSSPGSAPAAVPPRPAPGPRARRRRRGADVPWAAYAALLALLGLALALRVHNLGHGLPWAYHSDEALHFTSKAMRMLEDGTLNPGYFENSSAFTYLLYVVLRGGFALGILFPDARSLLALYASDPTGIYEVGRWIATLLCLLGIWAVFEAGRRLWDAWAGIAAAAVLAFCFLAVAYSRFAVTDTGALAPVALALLWSVRAMEDGRRRWFLLAGAAIGAAVAFKYTAGVAALALGVAGAVRLRDGGGRRAFVSLVLATGVGIVVFLLADPYFLLDLKEAVHQLRHQSDAAAVEKLGQGSTGFGAGFSYYVRSFGWGLGWAGTGAAVVGLGLLVREDRRRALVLAVFPLLLFVYLCTAGRYFGRWLLPTYPVLALLAGLAVSRAALAVARGTRRPWVVPLVLGALVAGVLVQPLLTDVRVVRLMGREDTRALARTWLLDHLPARARVVVEPAIPSKYFGGRLVVGFRAPPNTEVLGGTPQRFILSLGPGSIDRYRKAGYCTVVTMSTVQGRAEIAGAPHALAYYRRLDAESKVVFRASPYRPGAGPEPFNFDYSTHLYYPSAYDRPGPLVEVHRLDDCVQGTGGRSIVAPPAPWSPPPDPAS